MVEELSEKGEDVHMEPSVQEEDVEMVEEKHSEKEVEATPVKEEEPIVE